ncbi:hypothetical protein [Catellatospora citrea]|uniref:Uncharacterized protein n=1 Tax=Catellatospora citrea TaxID=53366 RepID=A0A8J3KMS7_9ACTN|nr:hypothetical protein [Catellatospora citrea]RKE11433.1 hypothetical protein C8E86_6360 [Catellatospora citrea]GIF99930.1 hypothetical protein Cci01nite_50240 [Catellatospora citrea]
MEILPASMFVPVALGFFGLATGYLIYGPQELFGYPPRDRNVDRSNGVWGIWMPGFCQLLVGLYLFVGLTWFEVFTTNKTLYMAALAFSAYGIHWFAMGWIRLQGSDARPNGYMSIPFVLLGILGMLVFFRAGDWPLGLLFTGLTLVYVAEFFASFNIGGRPAHDGHGPLNPGQKVLGLLHILVGLWLLYLTFAATLNLSSGTHLPA